MKFMLILFFLPVLAFSALPSKEFQFKKSLRTLISNSTKPDVLPGMVVASPSRNNPDYYYDWVRDTALVYRALIDYFDLTRNPRIKEMIFTWVQAERFRQNQPTISGLGEPKYFIDGSGYTGGWGRPQNDGPALRAIAMIKFARLMLAENNQDYVLKNLYHGVIPADSPIKKDLEYTAYHWKKPSFELWEEEMGMHFYTLLAQHTALQEGAKLARELRDDQAGAYYEKTALEIGRFITKNFLDTRIGIKATIEKVNGGLGYKNSNIDVAPLLALNHTYPYQKLVSFYSPAFQKYLKTLVNTFKDIYEVNKSYPSLGIAIGRYPEDRYDGYKTTGTGNPWFLTTLALGESYCLSQNESRNTNLLVLAQKQFERALFHSDRQGAMSEQFNRKTGYMQGAYELTWSHGAFLTAMMRCGFIRL